MSLGLAFWITMLIWLVLGIYTNWPNLRSQGGNLILFILLVLLGWQVFGAPLHS
jgi:hypothetical protein